MVRRAAGLLVAAVLCGCDLGSTAIPRPDPMVVVHAVLNPSLNRQVILLEESLTGKPAPVFTNPNNPILTSGGIPITGAVVQVKDETGQLYTATQEAPGVYSVLPMVVQPGMRYSLTVQALGKTVTASTTVPRGTVATAAPSMAFNRDHDTAKVSMPAVEFARGYLLRVDAPIAAFSMVTTDRDIAITGDTRNLYTENLLRVFFPGFEQALTVAAADTNLYDYYRSRSDPFSGVGLINHVEGGLGVFGSIAVIERRVLSVTQDFSGHPLEDTFTRRDPAPDSVPSALHFYRESPAKTPDSQDRLSGYYINGPTSNPVRGPFIMSITQIGTFDVQMFKPHTTTDPAGAFRADPVLMADTTPKCCAPPDTVKVYFDGVPGVLRYVRQGK